MSHRFPPSHPDQSGRTAGESPDVAVSERVALSVRALGGAGQAWLAGLPTLLTDLSRDWAITIGARLDGGRTAYVAEATTHDGTPAVLKVSIPSAADDFTPFHRELAALQLAGGDPYVRLIRHDAPRQALLLERLGPPMAVLGWPAARQLKALARTAARGWRPVPDGPPDGEGPAGWHATFIPSMWEELARPCSPAAVDLAVRCAAARQAAFDRRAAVLVHGDVHAFNALRKPGPDVAFRLVDPEGLISEPAHDLGVIQARGVPGRLAELAAGDPRQALEKIIRSCRQAGRMTGVDPYAVWQWACTEIVSTGLHLLRLGDHEEADTFLVVADHLAAATATAKTRRTRSGEPAGGTADRPPSPRPGDVRPEPATLFLIVGLPGAGKTTRAKELAATHRALRLTPDEWMILLFDGSQPDGKRDLLEGRLIALALQALRLGTNVVLDFGLWSRDERSALRRLAATAGAAGRVIYLPVEIDVQRARIAHRQATAPHTTFPMSEADIRKWRTQFEAPDAAELAGGDIPDPPPRWPDWPRWASNRWPSLTNGDASEGTDATSVDG